VDSRRGSRKTSTPYESAWIQVDERYYKVLCVPTRLPSLVFKYLNGDLVAAILATAIYAALDRPPYAVRVYWIHRVWWRRLIWHEVVHEEFEDNSIGRARARALAAELGPGMTPQ
jgi:hypothetical protein